MWNHALQVVLLLLLSSLPVLSWPGITGPLLPDTLGQPDPCIFFDNPTSTYYCYADNGVLLTSSQVDTGWSTLPDYTISNSSGGIYKGNIGAPSVAYLNDQYIMYFSSATVIMIATSSSPHGPFTLLETPLLIPGPQPPGTNDSVIAFPAAPAIFFHEGHNYMLYKYGRAGAYNHVSAICIRELSSDGLTAIGKSYELFTVTENVEQDSRQFTEDEGPNMVYHDGIFYLFFNAGTWCASTYQIVYATGTSLTPSSPYQYQGILLQTSPPTYDNVTLNAPGGISFVDPTTFIFMSYMPDAQLTCGHFNATNTSSMAPTMTTAIKPTGSSRYIHAGRLIYLGNGSVSVANSWED